MKPFKKVKIPEKFEIDLGSDRGEQENDESKRHSSHYDLIKRDFMIGRRPGHSKREMIEESNIEKKLDFLNRKNTFDFNESKSNLKESKASKKAIINYLYLALLVLFFVISNEIVYIGQFITFPALITLEVILFSLILLRIAQLIYDRLLKPNLFTANLICYALASITNFILINVFLVFDIELTNKSLSKLKENTFSLSSLFILLIVNNFLNFLTITEIIICSKIIVQSINIKEKEAELLLEQEEKNREKEKMKAWATLQKLGSINDKLIKKIKREKLKENCLSNENSSFFNILVKKVFKTVICSVLTLSLLNLFIIAIKVFNLWYQLESGCRMLSKLKELKTCSLKIHNEKVSFVTEDYLVGAQVHVSGIFLNLFENNYECLVIVNPDVTFGLTFYFGFFVFLSVFIFSIIHFSRKLNILIIKPIEFLFKYVKSTNKHPLSISKRKKFKKEINDLYNSSPIYLKIKHLQKHFGIIYSLLSIGLGPAGDNLIQNFKPEATNFPEAKKINAIFCFINIKHFEKLSSALKERLLQCINTIAAVVHQQTLIHDGEINRNLGDVFLLIWRINDDDSKRTQQKMFEKSLTSVINILHDIYRNKNIYEFEQEVKNIRKDFSLDIAVGLHSGWAIEGSIGSKYKIDSSYLSPNVNIAARLMAACCQYKKYILLSENFYRNLNDKSKDVCRVIDVIAVKGSVLPIAVFSVELTREIFIDGELPIMNRKELNKLNLELKKKAISKNLLGLLKEKRNIQMFMNRSEFTKFFYETFREGFDAYVEGNWEEAKDKLETCLLLTNKDTPSVLLYNYISEFNFISPKDWKGYRQLTSK